MVSLVRLGLGSGKVDSLMMLVMKADFLVSLH